MLLDVAYVLAAMVGLGVFMACALVRFVLGDL